MTDRQPPCTWAASLRGAVQPDGTVHEFIAFGAQGTGSAKCESIETVITDEVAFELSHDLLPGQGMAIRVVYGPD